MWGCNKWETYEGNKRGRAMENLCCGLGGKVKCKHKIFCLRRSTYSPFFRLFVLSDKAAEGNEIQSSCNVLIFVTKCSKFGKETATVWMFQSRHMSLNCVFLLYITFSYFSEHNQNKSVSRLMPKVMRRLYFGLCSLFIFGHKS